MSKSKLNNIQKNIVRSSLQAEKDKIIDKGEGAWVEELNQLSIIEKEICGGV